MRRTLLLCRVALAGGATVLALGACGGGSNDTAATTSSPSTSTTTTAAPTTTPTTAAGAAAFCAQAKEFAREVESSIGGSQQNADVGQQLQQLAGQLRSITPPAEIAADWQSVTSAVAQMAQVYAQTNLSDPQALAQLQQKLAPVTQQLSTSAGHIDQYLQTQCGFPGAGHTATTNTG